MIPTIKGYECTKCTGAVSVDVIHYNIERDSRAEPVYVVKNEDQNLIVAHKCPKCGNNKVTKRITSTIGEHSGVKSDRTIQKFKCISCNETWVEV
jgi:predicted RNA-binding Zn-ribbon protein involved in translation (DUF1610 family)